MTYRYFIKGKLKGETRYKRVGTIGGEMCLVINKIHAYFWESRDRARKALKHLSEGNDHMEFKLAKCKAW